MYKKDYLCVMAAIFALLPNILYAQAPDTLWTRRYNGPANGYDYARACVIHDSGYIYITGESFNGVNQDLLTIKYNTATGDTIWTSRYNGPANSTDAAFGCAVDNFSNLYVTGYSVIGGSNRYLTIKYNAITGDTIWTRWYSGPANLADYARACVVDGIGNLYVTGWSDNGANTDYLTIKYNTTTGDTIWTRRYNGPANFDDCALDCAADSSGNLYVTGYSTSSVNADYLTIKYNTNTGDTVWTRRYNGEANDIDDAEGCALDESGYLYITGYSSSGAYDGYRTIKYNTISGDTIWTRWYKSTGDNNYAYGCTLDSSGNLYVAGSLVNATSYDYLTVKYNTATGDTIWTSRYNGEANGYDCIYDCAVDALGNLYVTGFSYNGTNHDFLTIKYNTATGVEGKPELPMTVSKLRLEQNKPNPFSQHTTIIYQLPTSGPAILKIYNTAGQLLKNFNMGQQQAGYHQVEWSDSNIPAGVYFYRLTAGNHQATKKLVVLK